MKKAKMNLRSAVWCFVVGAMCLVLGVQNDYKTLDLVVAGLSFFTGVINLISYFKARRSDDKSGKES